MLLFLFNMWELTHISGHTLDLIITRSTETIVWDIATLDPVISDHEAIIFTLHLQKPPPVMKTIQYQSIAKINSTDFNNDLTNSNLIQQPPSDL